MTDTKVDYDQALALLREVAEGKEDFIYQSPFGATGSCVNFTYADDDIYCKDRTPSCIVGHVLDKLGLLGDAGYIEGVCAFPAPGTPWRNFTEGALELLKEAQVAQDSGNTWGESIDRAVKCATK